MELLLFFIFSLSFFYAWWNIYVLKLKQKKDTEEVFYSLSKEASSSIFLSDLVFNIAFLSFCSIPWVSYIFVCVHSYPTIFSYISFHVYVLRTTVTYSSQSKVASFSCDIKLTTMWADSGNRKKGNMKHQISHHIYQKMYKEWDRLVYFPYRLKRYELLFVSTNILYL